MGKRKNKKMKRDQPEYVVSQGKKVIERIEKLGEFADFLLFMQEKEVDFCEIDGRLLFGAPHLYGDAELAKKINEGAEEWTEELRAVCMMADIRQALKKKAETDPKYATTLKKNLGLYKIPQKAQNLPSSDALGNKLRELREQNTLTQSRVAGILGLRYTTVDSWEKGLTTPSAKSLEKLSKLYNCPLSDLKGLSVYC